MKAKIKYWNLGRSNAKGEFIAESETEEGINKQMYKEFSKHLMSREISFDEGKIFAGFRNVGNYLFVRL